MNKKLTLIDTSESGRPTYTVELDDVGIKTADFPEPNSYILTVENKDWKSKGGPNEVDTDFDFVLTHKRFGGTASGRIGGFMVGPLETKVGLVFEGE